MAVSRELWLCAIDGKLSIADVSVSELQELVLQPDTKDRGLTIIGQASVNAVMSILAGKMGVYNINNEANRQLVKEYEGLVDVKGGKVTVNAEGVARIFKGYVSYYFEPTNGLMPKVNAINVLKGMLNVPNNIKLIKHANRIIRQVDSMNQKYLSNSGRYCLPENMKKSIEEIMHEAESGDQFFKRMKYFGKEEFFRQAIRNQSELGSFFAEYGKDAEELKELMKKQQEYMKKKMGYEGVRN